ncbi:hypothetical protein AOQ84DRAFT_436537 [Glonium stellatum]|uniref:Uncharacterized protein n=1 Tax=Glonium stellatum TaxID=574774 RepID=A0A8E2F9L6_9PEZI|nr:hypothetical protein AOQ84DRAFT_436537 [Glonium stellatum]
MLAGFHVSAHANAVSGGISEAHAYMRFALAALRRSPEPQEPAGQGVQRARDMTYKTNTRGRRARAAVARRRSQRKGASAVVGGGVVKVTGRCKRGAAGQFAHLAWLRVQAPARTNVMYTYGQWAMDNGDNATAWREANDRNSRLPGNVEVWNAALEREALGDSGHWSGLAWLEFNGRL